MYHVLDKSTFGTTNDIATGDQKVVQDTDVNELERVFQSLGYPFICRTKLIILARMIMNQHHGRRLHLKDHLHHFPRVHARTVNRAAKELDETQKPVMGVKQDDAEIFAVPITQRDC